MTRVSDATNYNYFRDYDPSIGRYVESDPLGLVAGVNTYAYVDGNPLAGFDIWGLANSGPGLRGTCGSGPDCNKAADECHAECEHKLGKGGRTNQGVPYRNCWTNCMERKGCRALVDPLPDFRVSNRPDPKWLLLLILVPFPGNPLYGGA